MLRQKCCGIILCGDSGASKRAPYAVPGVFAKPGNCDFLLFESEGLVPNSELLIPNS